MDADGLLQLLDVLRPTFPERSLGLPVPLLPFLRGGIYLHFRQLPQAGDL